MADRRIRFVGRQQRQALHASLGQALTQWSQAWCVGGSRAIELEPQATVHWPDGLRWRQAGALKGVLWLGATDECWNALPRVLLGVAQGDGLGMEQAIGERATRALMGAWAGVPLRPVSADAAPPDSWWMDPRSGACAFRVVAGGHTAVLVLDATAVARWTPEAAPGERLASRESALTATSTRWDVVLGFDTATVQDASELRVGDILLSHSSLDARLTLEHPAHGALAEGRLVSDGEHRALLLEAVRKNRTPTPNSRTSP